MPILWRGRAGLIKCMKSHFMAGCFELNTFPSNDRRCLRSRKDNKLAYNKETMQTGKLKTLSSPECSAAAGLLQLTAWRFLEWTAYAWPRAALLLRTTIRPAWKGRRKKEDKTGERKTNMQQIKYEEGKKFMKELMSLILVLVIKQFIALLYRFVHFRHFCGSRASS